MANEKSIVRADQVPQLMQPTISREVALQRIDEIKQNPSLPLRRKRELVNTVVAAMLNDFKKEIEHREKLKDMMLASDARMAQEAISAYQYKVIIGIKEELRKFLGDDLDRKLFARFDLMAKLGERLTEFKKNLAQKNIEEQVLKHIIAQVDSAVNEAIEQLGKRITDLKVPEVGEQRET